MATTDPNRAQSIKNFWDTTGSKDTNALMGAMAQFGVGTQELSGIVGVSPDDLYKRFRASGADSRFGGYTPRNSNEMAYEQATGKSAVNYHVNRDHSKVTAATPEAQQWMQGREADVRNFWNQNRQNPKAVMDAMTKYGVSTQELSRITNIAPDYLDDMFRSAGAQDGFGGYKRPSGVGASTVKQGDTVFLPETVNGTIYTMKNGQQVDLKTLDPKMAYMYGIDGWDYRKAGIILPGYSDAELAAAGQGEGAVVGGSPGGLLNSAESINNAQRPGGPTTTLPGTMPPGDGSSPGGPDVGGVNRPVTQPPIGSVPAPVAPNIGGSTDTELTPEMSVEERAAAIAASDSPLMQQARGRAMQQMNERGLINSSIGIQAGQEAVLDRATDIAKADAQTAFQNSQNNANRAQQMQIAQLQAETSLKNAQLSSQTQLSVAEINRQYSQMANLSSTAASLMTAYNNDVNNIVLSDLPADAKEAAINARTRTLRLSMNVMGSINGDVDMNNLLNGILG